jgi:Mg-chelatase subunit ChlD
MPSTANQQVFNLIVLDESGSMTPVKEVTITGFNEIVQTIQGAQKQFPHQQHRVSLVTFNGLGIRTLLDNQPAAEVLPLSEDSYTPDASTPLFDALGRSLLRLEFQTEGLTDPTVLVSILTDGDENASREFNATNINALVNRLTQKGWSFTYMGANHAVEQVASSLSIKSSVRFETNHSSMEELFEKDRKGRLGFFKKRSEGMSSQEAEKGYWDQE